MNKILPLVFDFSFTTAPVFAWGEGGCPLSNEIKVSQDETVKQVDVSESTDS